MASSTTKIPRFNLSPDKREPLSVRLSDEQLDRLAEVGKKVSRNTSVLVRSAIHTYISEYRAGKINRRKPGRFDIGEPDLSDMPKQVLVSLEEIAALEDIAAKLGRDRSRVIRDAVGELIAHFDKTGGLD